MKVFRPRTPPEAISLCGRLLEYSPEGRISPLESCAHAFFDELRLSDTKLSGGRSLPPLFNFNDKGLGYDLSFLLRFALEPVLFLPVKFLV